jgi:diguanylate cyclase (GGDEF)-like protein
VTFLITYTCLGAAALDPSLQTLLSPGPAVVDRLTKGRLAFLGVALAITPILGGGRELLGLPVDGLLLVGSTLAVVPLVMLRIGVLNAERARAERALTHQATHDGLTGLPNRTELMDRLRSALRGDTRVVLLFCDLDGFKAINDRLGHLAGDELLVQVAARLATCRGDGDTLARYGGDEFVMVSGEPAAEATIRRAMSRPFTVCGEQLAVGASVGVVTARRGTDAETLLRQADAAMYAAKRARSIVGTREGVDRS